MTKSRTCFRALVIFITVAMAASCKFLSTPTAPPGDPDVHLEIKISPDSISIPDTSYTDTNWIALGYHISSPISSMDFYRPETFSLCSLIARTEYIVSQQTMSRDSPKVYSSDGRAISIRLKIDSIDAQTRKSGRVSGLMTQHAWRSVNGISQEGEKSDSLTGVIESQHPLDVDFVSSNALLNPTQLHVRLRSTAGDTIAFTETFEVHYRMIPVWVSWHMSKIGRWCLLPSPYLRRWPLADPANMLVPLDPRQILGGSRRGLAGIA